MEDTNQNQPEVSKEEPKSTPKGNGKNTSMAVIAYIIFFVPLLTDAKNDPFVKYHVKQGLVLFLFSVVLSFIPFVAPLAILADLAFMIIGIINASNGVEKPLPFIGQLADKFKF